MLLANQSRSTPNCSVLCQYANADFAPVVALIERIEGK
jgi:hypothetical protein